MTSEPTFADECREAFMRLAIEHSAIDPHQPGCRERNRHARLRKHVAIDGVLDQYHEGPRVRSHHAHSNDVQVRTSDGQPYSSARS